MSKKTHAERQRDWQNFCVRQDRVRTAGQVRVFYHEQDTNSEEPCLLVTRELARDMKIALEGEFINRGKDFRLFSTSPAPAPRYVCSESTDSAASISPAEMLANVGITEDEAGTPAPRHIVRRAKEKIRAIRDREGFDRRAPLAFGSRPGLLYTSAYGRS